MLQLALDPVEASGLLAPPTKEPHPPLLLQSGLGDATMPKMATEILARTYNASVLPNNPRKDILGITTVPPAAATNSVRLSSYDENYRKEFNSPVTWTELLFEKEYQCMPNDNRFWSGTKVHNCVAQDCALMAQISAFINTGEIIDPCVTDHCQRSNLTCYIDWEYIMTRPENWTCDYTKYF